MAADFPMNVLIQPPPLLGLNHSGYNIFLISQTHPNILTTYSKKEMPREDSKAGSKVLIQFGALGGVSNSDPLNFYYISTSISFYNPL